jgi:L-ascorbate metabolism protein UlaG (beta-lactamase superfamily)
VTSWRIGEIEVRRVDSANFVLPSATPMPDWAMPAFTPSAGETPIAFSAIVVRTPSAVVVVDPWLVDEAPRTRPDADVEPLLEALAVPPSDVDVVVHSHVDGIGWSLRRDGGDWVPTFPRARYVVPADELAAIDGGAPINGELDVATAAATRRAILDELATRRGALLTTLVGGPGGGLVERDGNGYRLVPVTAGT